MTIDLDALLTASIPTYPKSISLDDVIVLHRQIVEAARTPERLAVRSPVPQEELGDFVQAMARSKPVEPFVAMGGRGPSREALLAASKKVRDLFDLLAVAEHRGYDESVVVGAIVMRAVLGGLRTEPQSDLQAYSAMEEASSWLDHMRMLHRRRALADDAGGADE